MTSDKCLGGLNRLCHAGSGLSRKRGETVEELLAHAKIPRAVEDSLARKQDEEMALRLQLRTCLITLHARFDELPLYKYPDCRRCCNLGTLHTEVL